MTNIRVISSGLWRHVVSRVCWSSEDHVSIVRINESCIIVVIMEAVRSPETSVHLWRSVNIADQGAPHCTVVPTHAPVTCPSFPTLRRLGPVTGVDTNEETADGPIQLALLFYLNPLKAWSEDSESTVLSSALRVTIEHWFSEGSQALPFVLVVRATCRWRWVRSNGGMILTGENWSIVKETCPSTTAHHKF